MVRREDRFLRRREIHWKKIPLFLVPGALYFLWRVLGLEGIRLLLFTLLILPLYGWAAARVLNGIPGEPGRKDPVLQRLVLHLSGIIVLLMALLGWAAAMLLLTGLLAEGRSPGAAAAMIAGISVGWSVVWLVLWIWPVLPWVANWPVSSWVWWEIHHLHPGLKDSLKAALGAGAGPMRSLAGTLCGLGLTAVLIHQAHPRSIQSGFFSWFYPLILLPVLHLLHLHLARRALDAAVAKWVPPPRFRSSEGSRRRVADHGQKGRMPSVSPAPARIPRRPIPIAYGQGRGITYHPENPDKPMELYSGPRGDVGIMLPAREALFFRWEDHFRRAGALWFRPWVEQLVRTGRIDLASLERELRKRREEGEN